MKFIVSAFALTVPVALAAQTAPVAPPAQNVVLTSKVFVAKAMVDETGKKKNTLVAPDRVIPGDPLVIILEYRNAGAKPASSFVINNPIPGAMSYTGAEQAWAVVSVDGGKSYGALATLKLPKGDGTSRPAIPADVTHVRWKFVQPIPPAGSGRVMFYGTVK